MLRVVPSGEDRYYLTTFNTGVFTLRLRLPQVLVPGGFPGYLTPPQGTWCDQCILQWTYTVP